MLTGEDCPCEKCKQQYEREKTNKQWLETLNKQLPCPCRVNTNNFGVTPIDDPSGRNPTWNVDAACMARGLPLCWKFHEGAYGCIRSNDSTLIGKGTLTIFYG